jgi:hypothetical protein
MYLQNQRGHAGPVMSSSGVITGLQQNIPVMKHDSKVD